jgi:hypothetical protein
MQQKFPLWMVEDDVYYVNVDKGELRQVDVPENAISFHDMEDKGSHYVFLYDRAAKKLISSSGPIDHQVVRVVIPPMVRLDPQAMAMKYGLQLADLADKNDFEIIIDRELLTARLKGRLPRIDIAGLRFKVNLHLHELTCDEKEFTRIDLRHMDLSDDGESMMCLYNIEFYHVAYFNEDLRAPPRSTVMLKIPGELQLDPVGIALRNGHDMRSFLRRHPLQRKLRAAVIPFSNEAYQLWCGGLKDLRLLLKEVQAGR